MGDHVASQEAFLAQMVMLLNSLAHNLNPGKGVERNASGSLFTNSAV
jgi:hypothetical protein